jgi:hypothetical protein
MYFGLAERDAVMLPFVRAGLQAGHKCMCIVDAPDVPEVISSIGDDIDAKGRVASLQLDVRKSTDAYLSTGRFAPNEMLAFLDATVSAATGPDGYPFVRTTGEAAWALDGGPGTDELFDYESELNHFVGRYPQAILCLYDLNRFGGGMMLDMLRTHPKILLGGLVLENPHYLTPDEFRASRQ